MKVHSIGSSNHDCGGGYFFASLLSRLSSSESVRRGTALFEIALDVFPAFLLRAFAMA